MLITFYVKILDFDKMSVPRHDGDNPFPPFKVPTLPKFTTFYHHYCIPA